MAERFKLVQGTPEASLVAIAKGLDTRGYLMSRVRFLACDGLLPQARMPGATDTQGWADLGRQIEQIGQAADIMRTLYLYDPPLAVNLLLDALTGGGAWATEEPDPGGSE